jgi:uncharacterized protein DUF5655
MSGRECYHCKQWVEEGEAHDCWTTTEAALTRDLSEDLQEAWERLRETVVEYGEQRIYASHHSIMFARRACYFFVRPKQKYLEVCIFLGRPLKGALVRSFVPASKTRFANLLRIVHRDQVEAPLTDWLAEAYAYVEQPRTATARTRSPKKAATRERPTKRSSKRKTARSRKQTRS